MESDLSYFLALFFCVFLSAIFSASETALTSLPESYFRKIIEEKKGIIAPFSLWLYSPNRILTAIIIANNLVNTLAAVLATVYAQRLFSDYVISIATFCVTLALLIFGEITPKTFARHNAKYIVKWLLYAIYPVYLMLYPAVLILSYLAVFLVHSFGGKTSRVGPLATEDDIAYLIKLSHEEGVFKQEQGKMLQSVMSFRDTLVREVMIPRTDISSLDINSNYQEVMQNISQHGYTRWPVYEEDIDHVVGVLYVKDLINFTQKEQENFNLKKVLRKPLFVPESMKLDGLLKELQKQKMHLAIVVDEYGGTSGVITMEDLLEEIVGEIRDEYDKEEEEETVSILSENHFIVDGRTSISDLEKKTDIILPTDESYDSVGGFLIFIKGKIPTKNSVVEHEDWRFKVVEVEETRILKIEITKIHPLVTF